MREPTSCRSIDEHVEPLQHLRRRLAGLAVERVDRHASRRIVRVPGLDHVVLHVGAIAMLRAEDGRERDIRRARDGTDDVLKVRVDGGGVRHDADPLFFQGSCRQQPL